MTKSKNASTLESNENVQPKKHLVVRTNFNYVPNRKDREKNSGISSTIPGQAPSLNSLLQRVSQGLPVESRVPIYDSVGRMIDLRTLDLVDRQKLAERMNTEFSAKKQELEEAKQRKSEADKAARIKEKEELYAEFKTRFAQEQKDKP